VFGKYSGSAIVVAIIGQFLVTMETDDSEQPIESPEDIDEDSYNMSNDPNNRSVS
jgi:hypothetical protein